jgi:hypothetical protein
MKSRAYFDLTGNINIINASRGLDGAMGVYDPKRSHADQKSCIADRTLRSEEQLGPSDTWYSRHEWCHFDSCMSIAVRAS